MPFVDLLKKIYYNDKIIVSREVVEHNYDECSSLNSVFE